MEVSGEEGGGEERGGAGVKTRVESELEPNTLSLF